MYIVYHLPATLNKKTYKFLTKQILFIIKFSTFFTSTPPHFMIFLYSIPVSLFIYSSNINHLSSGSLRLSDNLKFVNIQFCNHKTYDFDASWHQLKFISRCIKFENCLKNLKFYSLTYFILR